MIGELVRVPLTDVWRNEPEFSRWLRDNIERLNVVLGIALSDPQCEGSVGDFSVDLVAEHYMDDRNMRTSPLTRSWREAEGIIWECASHWLRQAQRTPQADSKNLRSPVMLN